MACIVSISYTIQAMYWLSRPVSETYFIRPYAVRRVAAKQKVVVAVRNMTVSDISCDSDGACYDII
eukprot:scaffold270666_cov21-Prasinocladus_malaysianus.AAC.1